MADLTQITSPSGVKFTVAKDAADAFSGFLTDLEGAGYKIDQKTSGGYNPRNIAGTSTPSQHSFGRAIDINPTANARGAKTSSDLPANVNDIAAAHGLTWGGTWSGDTRDPMHFELSGKPAVADTGPSADDLLKRMDRLAPAAGAGGGAATGAAPAPAQDEGPSGDDLLRRMEGLAPTPPPATAPGKSGYPANIGAGALEGVAGGINLATDPASSFLSMLKVPNLLIAAHDALAGTQVGKMLGADKPFTPEAKSYLLGADTAPGAFGSQPGQGYGSNLIHMLGSAVGTQPEDITAATPGERVTREAATGATMGALTGNLLAVPAGAAGSIGASELPRMLPEDTPELARALAELPAGVLSAMAAGGAGAGAARFGGPAARASGNALSRPVGAVAGAFDRFARGADEPPPEAAPPSAPPEGPTPAGAMVTPPQLATFTPQETAAYRASAEGRKLMENQEIGVPDRNAYIPGVTVSAAEQELTAELARELKSAGGEDTAVSQDIKATAQRNDQLRRDYIKDTTGDEVSVHNIETAQKADIEEAKPRVFGEDNVRGDVYMAPLLEQIDKTRNALENRQNPELQKVLGDLRERLVNPDGTPKEMHPQEAWGLQKNIDRATGKKMAAEDPALHFEGHQLRTVGDTLAGEIEKLAPGYKDMRATYRAHAEKIEAMNILQEKTRGMLSQTTTPMRFSDFQRFMKNVVDMRKTSPTDLNPYKSITDEQMSRLWNVRDDLRRVATASELARAPGSDTLPNVMDLLKRHGPGWAAHAVANYISPGWGSVVVKALQGAAEPARAARAQARTRARAQELLHPPNPLINPNAPP